MATLGHKRQLSVKCEDTNERLLNMLAETSAFQRPVANTSAHSIQCLPDENRSPLQACDRHILNSPPPEHLGKDAADAPQVHGRGVAGLEQHLRRPVPQRHHLQRTPTGSFTQALISYRKHPLMARKRLESGLPIAFTHMTTLTVAEVIFLCTPL